MQLGGKFLTEQDLRASGFRKLGKNVRIHDRASIYGTENISIGDNARIDDFTVIIAVNGWVEIGCHVHIASHCLLAAKNGIVLQDFSGIAAGTKLHSASDDYSGEQLTGPTVPPEFTRDIGGTITVGRHVVIGTGSVVLPSCTIGEGSALGAMSLVIKDLEPWGVYVGIPVRRIKERKKDILRLEEQLLGRSL